MLLNIEMSKEWAVIFAIKQESVFRVSIMLVGDIWQMSDDNYGL